MISFYYVVSYGVLVLGVIGTIVSAVRYLRTKKMRRYMDSLRSIESSDLNIM